MSQLSDLCDKLKIKIVCEYRGVSTPKGWTPGTRSWKVRLRFNGRSLTSGFHQGPAHTKEPTAADVLACLVSDAAAGDQSFEDFCHEFGYDSDSRKAEQTWRACARMTPRVRRFLGDRYDEVAQAKH